MKKLIYLSILVLVGCGKQTTVGPQGVPGTPAPIPATFQGFYLLPYGGYAEIVNDSGNLNDIVQLRLVAPNQDGTFGLIPVSSVNNLPTVNGQIVYAFTGSYNPTNNNLRTDVGNTQLNGNFLTLLVISKIDNKLSFHIQVSNGPTIVFDHIVNQ